MSRGPLPRSNRPDGRVLNALALNRLGTMVAQLLDEQHRAPLDPPGQTRLRDAYLRALTETRRQLPDNLRDELDRVTRSSATLTTSPGDLRVAQAQLLGWLQGLFAGADFSRTITETRQAAEEQRSVA